MRLNILTDVAPFQKVMLADVLLTTAHVNTSPPILIIVGIVFEVRVGSIASHAVFAGLRHC